MSTLWTPNQFTKDFNEALAFDKTSDGFRLHPEFSLFYKFPSILPWAGKTTEDLKNNHKAGILNRHMRFQILWSFCVEKKPGTIHPSTAFISRKEQQNTLRNPERYEQLVKDFNADINEKVKNNKRAYFYWLDRWIKELATLCVLNKQNDIQDFIVFNKDKTEKKEKVRSRLGEVWDSKRKVFRYTEYQKESILDLTNIKVETWHCADTDHPNSVFLKEAFTKISNDPSMKKIMEDMWHDFSSDCKNFTILVKYPEAEW
jgi:hypothetical protein